jgi:hypothetical protein
MPGTVTVACRMPNGLRLRIWDFHEVEDQVIGGGVRTRKQAHRSIKPGRPEEVVLKGFAVPLGYSDTRIVGGYALTYNVDAEFMSEWFRQNSESDLVKNNIVFFNDKAEAVEKRARDHKNTLSGLEPLNTETTFKNNIETQVDPRWPKKASAATTAIQKASRDSA